MSAALVAWLIFRHLGVGALGAAWLLLLPAACWSTHILLPAGNDKDPSWVVVDEWLGQWLSLLLSLQFLPLAFTTFLSAFVAFRFFDILKPWPIRRLEHVGPDWWAIHADDLAAGVYAAAALAFLSWLLGRGG